MSTLYLPESLRKTLEPLLAKKKELPKVVEINSCYERSKEYILPHHMHMVSREKTHLHIEFIPDIEFDEKHLICQEALKKVEDRKELAELRAFKEKMMRAKDAFKCLEE